MALYKTKGEKMDLEKELRNLNKKYFKLYEMLTACDERFANMHLRIVENSKNIKKDKEETQNIEEKDLAELIGLIDLRSKANKKIIKKVLKRCNCNSKIYI